MQSIKFFILITGILAYQSLIGQESNFRIYNKVSEEGVIISRVVTYDSLDVMALKKGHLLYELLSNGKVIKSRELHMGDTSQLRALLVKNPEYYLNEMVEVMLDPDQPTTIDEAYPFLIFLSFYTFEGAKWLGLGTEDRVTPRQQYTVRYTLINKAGKKRKLGEKQIGRDKWPTKYMVPDPPLLTCGNHSVEIRLDAQNTNGVYFGFNAQRRIKGESEWNYISDFITINPYYESKYGKYRYTYKMMDTLEENHVLYEYRMVGMDYFGTYGTPGNSNECLGWEPLTSDAAPYLYRMVNDSTANLEWRIDESVLSQVKSIDLMMSLESETGKFNTYISNIDLTKREFQAAIPYPTGYFKYRTIPFYGDTLYSVPFVIQRWDNVAPAKPQGFEGKIDSNGIVKLKWKLNKESDFWGYRIFFANNKTDQFSLLTSTIVSGNSWKDTIDLNNLTPEIYYKIVCLDWRGNFSEFSDILTIEKPDTLPPSPAFIKQIKQYKNSYAILLLAVGGGSADLAYHVLYRKEPESKSFQIIDTLGIMLADTVLYDPKTEYEKIYEYCILAVDKHGNKRWSDTASIEVSMKGLLPNLKTIEAVQDTTLNEVLFTWTNLKAPDTELEIYRTNEKGAFTLYKVLPLSLEKFTDKLSTTRRHTDAYKVRVVYADGSFSKIKDVPVKIKS
ncbi:MAG: hypothetical protein IPF67_01450 [Saprospiraceae bacterium]|nr:hypothetical protein [Candidatus Brachybacter algidus]